VRSAKRRKLHGLLWKFTIANEVTQSLIQGVLKQACSLY
jgi:hypothetical protein